MSKTLIAAIAATLVSTSVMADATITGAVGYRNQGTEVGSTKSNADRVKAEVVFASKVSDQVSVVVGARTGSFNSAWDDIGNNTNLHSVGLNLAYAQYAVTPDFKLTVGKMNQPWVSTGLLFDRDIKPEGFAASYSNKTGIFVNASSLTLVDGVVGPDSKINSVQVGAKKPVAGLDVTAAVGVQKYNNVGAYTVQQGLVNVGTKVVGKPVAVFAELLKNNDAKTAGNASAYGVKFGNASAPKSYDVSVVRQKVEANSQYSLWNDSDFAGGQGNYEGTAVLANYVVAKGLTVSGKYFDSKRGNAKEAYKRTQLDVTFAF